MSTDQYLPIAAVIDRLSFDINTAISYRSPLVTISIAVAVSAMRGIEQLRAENDRLTKQRDELGLAARIAELEASIAERNALDAENACDQLKSCQASMVEALKPLAILLPSIDPDRPDDRVLYKVNDSAITYGDVRRAAALTQSQPQPLPDEQPQRIKLETPKLQYENGDFFFETFIGHFGASGGIRLTQDEVLQRVKKSTGKDGTLEWTGTELFFVPSLKLSGEPHE